MCRGVDIGRMPWVVSEFQVGMGHYESAQNAVRSYPGRPRVSVPFAVR